jgi:nitrilase
MINAGDAVVIKLSGPIAAGPLNREKAILYAEIDAEEARRARRSLDVCGHYARPDIFPYPSTEVP